MNGPIENIKEQIQVLNDITGTVDTSDLCQLAKMHECSVQMEEQAGQLPDTIAHALAPVCKQLAQANENIILEDCADPERCLQAVTHTVKQLAKLTLDAEDSEDVARLDALLAELKQGIEQSEQPADTETAQTALPEPQDAETIELEPIDYSPEPLTISDQEIEYVGSFLTECQEHIEAIEGLLLTIEKTPDDLDQINELFRPFHTIKGMAGFLNLKDVNALTHTLETVLDLARKGKLRLTPAIIDVVFQAVDVLKVQVRAIGEYVAKPTGQTIPQPQIAALLHRIRAAALGTTQEPIGAGAGAAGAKRLGEILLEDNRTTPEVVDFALDKQDKGNDKTVGELLNSMGAVKARDVSQALRKQKTTQETVIRVETVKLDGLINMVGELVIAQAQVAQSEAVEARGRLATLVEQVSKITRDVQEITMALRMVPIASTFQKMGRIARDIARKGDKNVNFVIEGEETELDKNVTQEIADPLMHMVRNAVDHGIEPPQVRAEKGKPPTGTVKLNAYHQGGNIVIEVSDDGNGLDMDVILQKAIDKGLVDPNAQLTDQQTYQLVMAPGFSLAKQVTDVSGRGVGMDVVKRNIEHLRGKVEIQSTKGEGTTFIIRLPLTLAVIDGMVVRAGRQRFIIPTLAIHRALVPTADQISTVQGKSPVLNLRGELYTLVSLADTFDIEDAASDPTEGTVVIVQAENTKIGIVLNELVGQQQVVIKSLGQSFRNVNGIGGGAVLGDGTVGLILEPAGLLELHQSKDK